MHRLREDGGAVADMVTLFEIHADPAALDLHSATRHFQFDSIGIVGKFDADRNAGRGVP